MWLSLFSLTAFGRRYLERIKAASQPHRRLTVSEEREVLEGRVNADRLGGRKRAARVWCQPVGPPRHRDVGFAHCRDHRSYRSWDRSSTRGLNAHFDFTLTRPCPQHLRSACDNPWSISRRCPSGSCRDRARVASRVGWVIRQDECNERSQVGDGVTRRRYPGDRTFDVEAHCP